MAICLGGAYGLACWNVLRDRANNLERVSLDGLDARIPTNSEAASLGLPVAPTRDHPVEYVVGDRRGRRYSDLKRSILWTVALPQNGFCSLGSPASPSNGKGLGCASLDRSEEVLLSSPPFCLLQMAGHSDTTQLVQAVMEVTGDYCLDAGARMGFRERRRLATRDSILAVARDCADARRGRKLAEAVELSAEGSCSPMETIVYLLACLPVSLGGYGLERPVLNKRIELDPSLVGYALRASIVADFLFAEPKLVVEYDSDQEHRSPHQLNLDARKRVTYERLGYRCRTLTSEAVMNPFDFEDFIGEIAETVGCDFARKSGESAVARDELRRHLLAQGG